MVALAPVLKQRFFDANGLPLAGGKIYTYAAGSGGAVNKSTYKSSLLTNPNTNPIILDASGGCDLWLDSGGYLIVVHDKLDNLIFTIDNVGGTSLSGSSLLFSGLAAISVDAGVKSLKTDGYSVAGRGAATYVYDANVNGAFVAAHPAWSFLAADGRGFRLSTEQQVTALMLGANNNATAAVAGTDNYNAWLAVKDFIHYFRQYPGGNYYYKPSVPVRWPTGGYEMSNYMDCTDAAYDMFGDSGSGATSGQGGTIFFTAAGKQGLILQSWDTAGVALINQTNDPAQPFNHGASGSKFRDMNYYSRGGTLGVEHGITIKCTGVDFERVTATNYGGDGFHVFGNTVGAGNANCNFFKYCGGQNNGLNGFFCAAGDANGIINIGFQGSFNRQFGIAECSFLGNYWFGYHVASNGMPRTYGCGPTWASNASMPGARAYQGGHTYLVVPGQEAAAATTTPGTNAAVWTDLGAMAQPAWVETWVSGHPYYSGGAMFCGGNGFTQNDNNRSFFSGYIESDQPGSYTASMSSTVFGGMGGPGAFLYGFGGGLRASNIGSRNILADGTFISAVLGGVDSVNGTWLTLGRHADGSTPWGFTITTGDIVSALYNNAANSNPFNINPPGSTVGMDFPRGVGIQNSVHYSSATIPPTTGTFIRGAVIWNTLPSAAGTPGCVCTTAGVAGSTAVFKNMANIAA